MNLSEARAALIGYLNSYSDQYPELKKDEYYFNENLGCWTTK